MRKPVADFNAEAHDVLKWLNAAEDWEMDVMRKFELLSATAIALFATVPAMAQTVPQESEAESTVDDIIVTATLRNENLQDVPIAVTAFSGETLEKAGVTNVKNFEQVSASFNTNSTQNESGGTTLRVRGVGTTGNNAGLESAVGIFIDGVYQSRPGVALGDLLDVQQIELLRGPQGTLFGRNTSAGALSIKTAKPNLNKFEAFGVATYGNYDLVNIQGGVSGPIGDGKAGFRLSGAYRNRDGFLINAAGGESNDRNRFIVRGQLLYEPNSDFSVRLIADYSKSTEKCCDAVIERESSYATATAAVVGGQALTLFGINGLPNNGGASVTGVGTVDSLRSSNNRELRDDSKQWGVSGEINYQLGNAKLTSITSYRDYESFSLQETDFVALNVFSTSTGSSSADANSVDGVGTVKTFTQELRLAGTVANDKFDYLVGGYYADEQIDGRGTLTLGSDHQAYVSAALSSLGAPGPNPARNIFAGGVNSTGSFANNRFIQSARNISVFTNNTFHVSDRFKVNFGVRYSDDRKKGQFDQLAARSDACTATRASLVTLANTPLAGLAPLAVALTCFPFSSLANNGPGTPQEFNRVFKDNELIYTGKLLWEPIDNINTYVSFSHGYKSGGFNLDPTAAQSSAAAPNGADPSFRSETVDAYELGIKAKLLDGRLLANLAVFKQDLQDFQVLEFTGVQFQTFNVKSAEATGFELELTGRPSRDFTVNGGVTYSDAKYGKDCDNGRFDVVVSPLCNQSLTNAPKWTVVSGFDWQKDIGEALKFSLNGNVRLESDRRVSTQALQEVATGTGNLTLANENRPISATNLALRTNNYVLIPNGIQDSNIKVNLRAGIGNQEGGWSLEFWGNNIFDVRTKNVTFNTPLRGVGTLPGPFNAGGIGVSRGAFLQEPRTYGVTARVNF
jgi:iron complex outermembrane recepter protein